ncbi:hypothetical protein [Catellatospora tritici]|uniref:hypothetical protein n=1 Tax=Catellatospora tritici TaxID=2851566 RepID=UPI001C2DCE99|nr:hypothetical protein [Catellatospora tritici]MBV1849387.1 hypothetical protein [Catellatospora tritici]
MGRAAALKIGIGAVLLIASFFQVVVPASMFAPPQDRLFGLALVPVFALGLCSALFVVGGIVAGEGICDAFGGTSLWDVVTRSPLMLPRMLACGATAGLVLEIVGQWLGRLWYYPWWTSWFYALVLIPGFALYWLLIVESYLAAKAVLDAVTRSRPIRGTVRLWPVGGLVLAAFLALSIRWYAERGLAFGVTGPTSTAPPFGYAVLAAAGVTLLSGAPVSAARHRYWVPFAAIVLAAAVVSLTYEVPNAVHRQWAYAHFPGPELPGGLPVAMFLAWPLQYVVFLALPSALLPDLAALFWRPPADAGPAGIAAAVPPYPGASREH